MEINGPTRIDNSDIEPVRHTNFEMKKISISDQSNNLVGIIGSSIDISGGFTYNNNVFGYLLKNKI